MASLGGSGGSEPHAAATAAASAPHDAADDVMLSLDGDALVRCYAEFKAVWDSEGRGLSLTEFVSCVLANTAPRRGGGGGGEGGGGGGAGGAGYGGGDGGDDDSGPTGEERQGQPLHHG